MKELDNQVGCTQRVRQGQPSAENEARVREQHRRAPGRDRDGWHLEAVGSGGVRGTGDKKTMDLAAYLYKKVVENFTPEDFAKFAVPAHRQGRLADASTRSSTRWRTCSTSSSTGRSAVRRSTPSSPRTRRAQRPPKPRTPRCSATRRSTTRCTRATRTGRARASARRAPARRTAKPKKGEWEKLKPKDLTDHAEGHGHGLQPLRLLHQAAARATRKRKSSYVEVKYARARTYFEAQHWEEAALGSATSRINHADKDAGIFAAQLYLESRQRARRAREPPRPLLRRHGEGRSEVHRALLRGQEGARTTRSSATLLTRIQFDIDAPQGAEAGRARRQQADKGNSRKRSTTTRRARDAYLEMWRKYCEEPLAKGEKPKQCEKRGRDRLQHGQGLPGRPPAREERSRRGSILLKPKYGWTRPSSRRRRSTRSAATTRPSPSTTRPPTSSSGTPRRPKYKGEFADQALSDAVVLRLGLGQEEQAIKDAERFNKQLRRARSRRRPRRSPSRSPRTTARRRTGTTSRSASPAR